MDRRVSRPGGRVSSEDVARLAGVSRAAVSRCFTPGASISPATRSKVLEAANRLGYRTNAIGRALLTRRSGLIGLVMGHFSNPFYPGLMAALADRLNGHGYRIMLFTAPREIEADPLIETVLSYQVEGIVLASAELSSRLAAQCADAGIPVVLINRAVDDVGVSSITSANDEGGVRIADFLLAGGHRRFAYIAGADAASTNRDREAGFRAVLQREGINLIREAGNYTYDGAVAATRRLLRRRGRPDAIFAANDLMALAALDCARGEFNLDVPRELSVVGFDDAPPAQWWSYGLTTMEQPVGAMVDALVAMLLERMEEPAMAPRTVAIPGRLIVRRSARRPAEGVMRDGEVDVWVPPASLRLRQ